MLARLQAIEKKSFQATEAFDFHVVLNTWKAEHKLPFLSLQPDPGNLPVASAVYVRWRRILLLQKLCVTGSFRGQGIGNTACR